MLKDKLRHIKHFEFVRTKNVFQWGSAKPELVRGAACRQGPGKDIYRRCGNEEVELFDWL